jgi:hypothetical protein
MLKNLMVMLVGAVLASGARGDLVVMAGSVTQVLVDSVSYGECMVALNPQPVTQDARCKGRWVAFSCSGDFNSKSSGKTKFDTALAAYVIEESVSVVVDTDQKHNGYCFAKQIKLVK